MQLTPEIIVLAGSTEKQGLLRSTFSFSFSINSSAIEVGTGEESLGYVTAKEAFSDHHVLHCKEQALLIRSYISFILVESV